MLGFWRWKRAVEHAEKYCTMMFVGLDAIHGRKIPQQVFGDAYVIGFLQQIMMHAAVEANGYEIPDQAKLFAVCKGTLEKLSLGHADQLIAALIEGSTNRNTHST